MGIESVSAPSLEDQTYTITDNALIYEVPEFSVVPADCGIIEYSFDTDSAIAEVVSFDDQVIPRTFTFHYDQDLDLSGQDYTDYF